MQAWRNLGQLSAGTAMFPPSSSLNWWCSKFTSRAIFITGLFAPALLTVEAGQHTHLQCHLQSLWLQGWDFHLTHCLPGRHFFPFSKTSEEKDRRSESILRPFLLSLA